MKSFILGNWDSECAAWRSSQLRLLNSNEDCTISWWEVRSGYDPLSKNPNSRILIKCTATVGEVIRMKRSELRESGQSTNPISAVLLNQFLSSHSLEKI